MTEPFSVGTLVRFKSDGTIGYITDVEFSGNYLSYHTYCYGVYDFERGYRRGAFHAALEKIHLD